MVEPVRRALPPFPEKQLAAHRLDTVHGSHALFQYVRNLRQILDERMNPVTLRFPAEVLADTSFFDGVWDALKRLRSIFVTRRQELSQMDFYTRAFAWATENAQLVEQRLTCDFLLFEFLMFGEWCLLQFLCHSKNITSLTLSENYVASDLEFCLSSLPFTKRNLLEMQFDELLAVMRFVASRFCVIAIGGTIIDLTCVLAGLFAPFRYLPCPLNSPDMTWHFEFSKATETEPATYITNIDFTHWLMYTLYDIWYKLSCHILESVSSTAITVAPYEVDLYKKLFSKMEFSDLQKRGAIKIFVTELLLPGERFYMLYKSPGQTDRIPENVIEKVRGERAVNEARIRAEKEYRDFLSRTDVPSTERHIQCHLMIYFLSIFMTATEIDLYKTAFFNLNQVPLRHVQSIVKPEDPVFVFATTQFYVYYKRTFYECGNDPHRLFALWLRAMTFAPRIDYLGHTMNNLPFLLQRYGYGIEDRVPLSLPTVPPRTKDWRAVVR